MENKLIIFTSDFCSNCNIVKTYLNNNKIPFEVADATTSENSKLLASKGFTRLPVIQYNGELTGDITIEKINAIVKDMNNAESK